VTGQQLLAVKTDLGSKGVHLPRAWTEDIQNSKLVFVLNVYETSWFILREERRLKVFENRVLRRIVGPTRGEVTGEWINFIMRSLLICTPTKYYSDDHVKRNVIVGARYTYGSEDRCIQGFGGET